jgi:isopentenyldiphosphate isomerase
MNVNIFNLVDYILLGKHRFNEEDVMYNTDEVSGVKLVTQGELIEMVNEKRINITPWFSLVIQNRVNDIWNTIANIKTQKESDKIICYL